MLQPSMAVAAAVLVSTLGAAEMKEGLPAPKEGTPLEVLEIQGDLRVDKPLAHQGKHLKLNGNLLLEKGGELVLKNCIVEMMCKFSREFAYKWRGGVLRTENCLIGGTKAGGLYQQANFELHDGEWHAVDTRVHLTYGIVFDKKKVGKFRAKRLTQGPNSDALIVSGLADCLVEDSTYDFAIHYNAKEGGRFVADLPVGKPVSRVFDRESMGKVDYRLELRNTTAGRHWWIFLDDVGMKHPPFDLAIAEGGYILPGLSAENLRGQISFLVDLEKPFQAGNTTIRRAGGKVRVPNMSYYLWGDQTDVEIAGPTVVNELMMWGGKMKLLGTAGTRDILCQTTTIDLHGKAGLRIQNARLGIPVEWGAYPSLGQITCCEEARLHVDDSELRKVRLIAKGNGRMDYVRCVRGEQVVLDERAGKIQFQE